MRCDVQTRVLSSSIQWSSQYIMQKAIKGSNNRATSHGFHVVFTCGEEKEKNLIGVTVPSVQFGRKRLSTLSGAVLLALIRGQKRVKPKPKGAQKKEDKFGHLK